MTTKTVSTRVDENVYKSLIDFSNQEGLTVSQVLHEQLMVMMKCNQEKREYDLECNIESVVKETPTFSQDSKIEKGLRDLDIKNLQEKILSEVENTKREYLTDLRTQVQNLETKMNRKLNQDYVKKGMACFIKSHF
jgi:hypothetical protein